jgi:hypothetical protein
VAVIGHLSLVNCDNRDYNIIMRLHHLLAPLVLCIALTGCKDQSESSAILPTACRSFPGTDIYKIDKRILWVQTNVDGVSSSVAETMFKQACAEATKNIGKIKINIQLELSVDQKQVLIIGFKRFWVLWDVRNGVDYQGVPLNYQVMNFDMLKGWFTQHLGRVPTPDQIEVVTLQDVQNTPKGEPMQLQTLAQIQDMVTRQRLDQNPP